MGDSRTASKHAVLERSYVEYSHALAELQDSAPFAAQPARRLPYLWSHYQQRNSHSSYARLGSFFHTRDKGYLGLIRRKFSTIQSD